MAVTKIFPVKGRIGKCINYVMNPEKTVEDDCWMYVDGINTGDGANVQSLLPLDSLVTTNGGEN